MLDNSEQDLYSSYRDTQDNDTEDDDSSTNGSASE